MTPGMHYDPEQVTTYMDKTTVRLLLGLEASRDRALEHLDITLAYPHGQFLQTKPVYIKQHSRFDGTFKQPCKARILIRNIYRIPQAARLYHNGLSNRLTSHGHKPTEADPCLLYKTSPQDRILIAINMGDFLSVVSIPEPQYELHATLRTKYKIKRLEFPSKYLKWHMKGLKDGSIHISQPTVDKMILTKLECSLLTSKIQCSLPMPLSPSHPMTRILTPYRPFFFVKQPAISDTSPTALGQT